MSGAVLVAGGAGYIGSHVCKALAEAGYTPVCYDTLEKGHEWAEEDLKAVLKFLTRKTKPRGSAAVSGSLSRTVITGRCITSASGVCMGRIRCHAL